MVLVPDEGAVQELATASSDPALGDRVHAGRPHVAQHGLDPGVGEDRVERGGEVRSPVGDHELHPLCLAAEVHDQVACLLRSPFPRRVQGDAEDSDAPGRVLDHGQDVGLGAVEQVDCEEVAGQDRVGLGAQELRPSRPGPPRRGADAVGLEDLPYGRRRDSHCQAGQFPVDPAVAPFRVFACEPEGQGLDVPAGGRAAGLAAHGPGGPAAPDDVAVPAQDRVRGDQQPQAVAAGFGYHAEQGREQGPVRPVQLRAARLPPLQDRELVAQDQDFGGLPPLLTLGQPQPRGDPRYQKEDEPQAHDR